MSQSVDRLKELLFDDEAQALSDLARKVDGIAEIDARGREELKQKLEQVFDRAGTTERLTASVAEVLEEALRQAEIAQHADLSRAIAPLVVTTIKSELRNSQDEMVEALYPITGRLVKSYVASAMKDLTDQMNRRLEQNPLMLRLQSLMTGKSVAELALAGTQDFEVRELYLIRRGSGDLAAHWPDTPMSGREQAMSGVLTAINEFANEAFAADQSSLRHIDLGGGDVYLRGSPLYLLAARCSGTAPQSVEQVIDDTFLAAVEKQHQIDQLAPAGTDQSKRKAAALAEVGQALQNRIADAKAELQRPVGSGGLLKLIAALILLPLLGWLGWGFYSHYAESRVREQAIRVIASVPGMQGYPAELTVGPRGRRLIISGLAPSQETKSDAIRKLDSGLPGTEVQDRLTVVAGSGIEFPDQGPEFAKIRQTVTDLEGGITRTVLIRASDRAEQRLRQAAVDLTRAATAALDPQYSTAMKRNAATLETVLSGLTAQRALLDARDPKTAPEKIAATYARLAQDIDGASTDILASSGVPASSAPSKAAASATPGNIDAQIERVATEAERAAALSATVSLAAALRPPPPVQLPPVQLPPVPPPQPTARDQLEAFVRTKAIFFANNSDYRDPAVAARVTEDLAALVKSAGSLVRVVGYTDEAGGQLRNGPLAQLRAEKVRDDLLAFGVPPSLLTAVGRSDALDVSASKGAFSPNRRVTFEIGYDGETPP